MAKVKISKGTLFERQEKKYMTPANRFQTLLDAIDPYMQLDQYGLHAISTVYYDTQDFALIRNSLDKPKFKQKLRLRSYGTPSEGDLVYLELKKKLAGVTYKRRMALPLCEAREYLHNGRLPLEGKEDEQTFGEIDWFLHQAPLIPQVALSYDRIALYGKEDKDFRITFDGNIRWRDHHLDLGQGDYGTALLPPGVRLMEIKTSGSLPLWLCAILSELQIYPQSFSKYGAVYTDCLMNAHREATRIAV